MTELLLDVKDLERHFDACLYSCFVGHEKPQRAIFDLALQTANLPPAATCFVDDLPRRQGNRHQPRFLVCFVLLVDRSFGRCRSHPDQSNRGSGAGCLPARLLLLPA